MKHSVNNVFAGFGRTWLILFLSCFMLSNANARPELGPPSIKLRTHLSNVVIAELDDISTEHKLSFSIGENLHNEAEQSVIIRSDALTAARLGVGQTYVIAYVGWDVKRFPRVTRPRRDGAVIIHLPGAMPAIFPPYAGLVELLQWDLDKQSQSPDKMLALILAGMAQTDAQLQNFFTTELITRPGLHAKLTEQQKQVLAGYLADSSYTPLGRNLMLSGQTFRELLLSPEANRDIARQVLTHHPVQVDFGSQYGGLIRTAMRIMQASESMADAAGMQRWLTSNQPTLVESAAEVIHAINPATLINAMEQAAQSALLEKHSRDALANLLQRYRHTLADNP